MKNLLLVKNQLKLASYILTSYLLLMITLTGLIEVYSFVTDPVKIGLISDVLVPRASAELPMKEWIKNRIENAGLDWKVADCIITEESSWREDICIIEPNMTISCGLWMLNTVHNKGGLTNACKTDYKCATDFAIKLQKEWNGWHAWSVYSKCK